MADKTITVNSLVQMGVVPQDVAGDLLNAPPRVNTWLEELEAKFKTNAFMAPAKPVADGAKTPKVPTAEEADQAEAMELLKAKRANDAKAKGVMVNALKANSKCKFTEDKLNAMSADDLKVLAESIGQPVANFAPGAGGVTPEAPKTNAQTFDVCPPMPTAADVAGRL